MSEIIRSLAPTARADARVLILGSMPGARSLQEQRYYAHPQNGFWTIMGALVGATRDKTYEERTRILMDHSIALWDVLASCVRPGSLDADIKNAEPNDFASFFANHSRLRVIGLNGGTATKYFKRHVQAPSEIAVVPLPSSSSAHARLRPEQKAEIWKRALGL